MVLYHGWDLNEFLSLDHPDQPSTRPHIFSPRKLYRPNDPLLAVIAKHTTLSSWRSRRRGPAFTSARGRILYQGAALNRFLLTTFIQTDPTRRSPPPLPDPHPYSHLLPLRP